MKFTIENGSFSYPKRPDAVLKNVQMTADSGDLVAILGPNGAGKTTLLRCAMGFLKWQSGQSCLDGQNIARLPFRTLWSSLAYVPQAKGQIMPYTVEEMVLLGRGSHFSALAAPKEKDVALARQVLSQLGILDLKDRLCTQLSGGELQMVLIGRALAAQPQVIILDEPESNLDFRNQLMVLETLSRLSADGITCIFNTHYPAHAIQRANKALLLNSDGSSLFGLTDDIVTEANLKNCFGVTSLIRDIETDDSIIQDVIPVKLADKETPTPRQQSDARVRLATISIIAARSAQTLAINALLHEYSRYLIGRMDMPYTPAGVNIINVNIEAPETEVRQLTRRLAALDSVSVKATFARSYLKEEDCHE